MIRLPEERRAYDVAHLCFINLDARTDRLAHMRRQLARCRWTFERIPAIRLTRSPTEFGISLLPSLADKWSVVGIWLSHRKALERALETGREGVFVILEDDVKIGPRFWSERLELPAALPDDWEIVLLSPRHRRPHSFARKAGAEEAPGKWIKDPFSGAPAHLRAIRRQYVTAGAHFVVLRDARTVRKILDAMDDCTALYHVDGFYMKVFETYGLYDPRVSTGRFGSDNA